MSSVQKQWTLEDYEDAVSSRVRALHEAYKVNGGNQVHRTTIQLLKEIHQITPYIEDLIGAIHDIYPLLDNEKRIAFDKLIQVLESATSNKELGDKDGGKESDKGRSASISS